MVTRRRMLMVPPAAAAAAVVPALAREADARRPVPGARARARPPRPVDPRAVRHLRAQPAGRAQHIPADGARRRGAAHLRAGPARAAGAVLGRPRVGDRLLPSRRGSWRSRTCAAPSRASGFVARFIDPAFNDCVFLWDSCFMTLFGRYGARAFPFVRTLDNFYAKQHPDGFICREIGRALGDDRFPRFDPSSTGPNVMAWAEWEHYRNFGDRDRLARVFPALRAYHQWLRAYRTWPDGGYWSTGWGCGMDNQPRLRPRGDALRRPGALPRAHDLGGHDAAADPVGAAARGDGARAGRGRGRRRHARGGRAPGPVRERPPLERRRPLLLRSLRRRHAQPCEERRRLLGAAGGRRAAGARWRRSSRTWRTRARSSARTGSRRCRPTTRPTTRAAATGRAPSGRPRRTWCCAGSPRSGATRWRTRSGATTWTMSSRSSRRPAPSTRTTRPSPPRRARRRSATSSAGRACRRSPSCSSTSSACGPTRPRGASCGTSG